MCHGRTTTGIRRVEHREFALHVELDQSVESRAVAMAIEGTPCHEFEDERASGPVLAIQRPVSALAVERSSGRVVERSCVGMGNALDDG